MNKLKNISEIDTTTKEGRLLLAALSILTTTENLLVLGKEIKGSQTEPDIMLNNIHDVQEEMFKDKEPIIEPTELVFEPKTFPDEITEVINRHSRENESNTPDFILSEYLLLCLNAFELATNKRDGWHKIEKVKA